MYVVVFEGTMPALEIIINSINSSQKMTDNIHRKEIEGRELREGSNNCIEEVDDVFVLPVVCKASNIEC